MARSRNDGAAEAAAAAASEAARVMQARQQEVRQQQEQPAEPEATTEPEAKPKKEAPRDIKRVEANPDRESKMEEIRKARGEKQDEPEVETAPKVPDKPAAEVQHPAEAPAEVPPAPTVKTVKVKVDGVESEVPEEEVAEYGGVRPYQVAKALENRLRKEAEDRAQDRKLFAQLLESVQKKAQPPEPQVSDDEFLKTKMDVIRFGTPEEGAAAMREVLVRISKPVDQNAIVAQATEKWRHDQAVDEFGREYGDVLANPTLAVLARALQNQGIEQLRRQPPPGPIDWKGFYARIGNEIRGVAGRPSQSVTTPNAAQTSAANQPGTPSQVSEKEARKEASIVNLPTAAARAALPEEPKPETREEAFARMKASRIS